MRHPIETNGKWLVQTGKYTQSYDKTYVFDTESQARFHYNCLNTHSGYKKRLVSPRGIVIARYIS